MRRKEDPPIGVIEMSDNPNPPSGAGEHGSEIRRYEVPIPAEGDNGVFTQNWFPLCLSSDVERGRAIGREFLGGRVVIFRGENDVVQVLSAYCAHVGADLSVGDVVGNTIRCAFHHWQYDQNGRCVKTAIGDPPPRTACLFRFPTQEKFGFVWAFNGAAPLWELPDLPLPDSKLVMKSFVLDEPFKCDGWIFACNTPDMQHIKVLHGITFHDEDLHERIQWSQFGFDYALRGRHQSGENLDWLVGIRGTSFFWRYGEFDGAWLGNITAFSLPHPGIHQVFACVAVEKGDRVDERLAKGIELELRTLNEDRHILNSIHYTQGTMTRSDRSLVKFMDYVRKFPRAHPSASFIR
jgi:nitrite reductase/ring-hydroxylating ferredoxin subunit